MDALTLSGVSLPRPGPKGPANFMKKQYLSHNNDAVENNVIAENLKELSKGDLILENPDDLVNTSTILREMGLNKKFTKPNNNFKQKKKFKG